ncbi:hypothetical protein EON77_09810, partial [bacterium]
MMLDRALRVVTGTVAAIVLLLIVVPVREPTDRIWVARSGLAFRELHEALRDIQEQVVDARIGLARHYDELNRAVNRARVAARKLRLLSKEDPDAAPAAAAIQAALDVRLPRIERFKSNNALLQNALARFSTLSDQSVSQEHAGHLPSDVLRLILDPGPIMVGEARAELDRLLGRGSLPPALEVQAKLVIDLLPAVSADLEVLRRSERSDAETAMAVLIDERGRVAEIEMTMRSLALPASVMALLLSVGALVGRGRNRIIYLKRQSANERLSATLARMLLAPDESGPDGPLSRGLEQLAIHAGVRRVFMMLGTERQTRVLGFPAGAGEATAAFERAMSRSEEHDWSNDLLDIPWLTADLTSGSLLLH